MKFFPSALAVLALLPATANAQTYAAKVPAARVDAINTAPITPVIYAKYANGVRVLPPPQYDRPYTGNLTLAEAPSCYCIGAFWSALLSSPRGSSSSSSIDKFKTRQQALDWCAVHYPDLSVKEDRRGSKGVPAKKSASATAER